MIKINSRALAENPAYYMKLASNQVVVVKCGKKSYSITPFENPSPSGDPYWADPRNIKWLHDYDKRKAAGKVKFTRLTPEKEKEWFGDL